MDARAFDDIVTDFYRAATGELPWAAALDGVQAAFGARAAVLQSIHAPTNRIVALDAGGPSLHECALNYLREFHRVDPRRVWLLDPANLRFGRWWHDHETHDDAFVAQDRYHQQFLPAYDMRYQSTVMLRPSTDLMVALALELPARRGVLSADERETARRLGEHLLDALRAQERVRALAAQALAGHGLLQAFAYPMWLLDADRYIHFANPAAVREVEAAQRLVQHGPRLLMTHPRADAQLTERLHVLNGARHGTSSMLDLCSRAGDPPLWLQLSSLRPLEAAGVFGAGPRILATLFDPQQVSALDPYALGQVLGLTPAQARVAAGLADGLSAEQIAAAQGTQVTTVRTHVRAVLGRLGARRVTDAVRALRQGEALWAAAV